MFKSSNLAKDSNAVELDKRNLRTEIHTFAGKELLDSNFLKNIQHYYFRNALREKFVDYAYMWDSTAMPNFFKINYLEKSISRISDHKKIVKELYPNKSLIFDNKTKKYYLNGDTILNFGIQNIAPILYNNNLVCFLELEERSAVAATIVEVYNKNDFSQSKIIFLDGYKVEKNYFKNNDFYIHVKKYKNSFNNLWLFFWWIPKGPPSKWEAEAFGKEYIYRYDSAFNLITIETLEEELKMN